VAFHLHIATTGVPCIKSDFRLSSPLYGDKITSLDFLVTRKISTIYRRRLSVCLGGAQESSRSSTFVLWHVPQTVIDRLVAKQKSSVDSNRLLFPNKTAALQLGGMHHRTVAMNRHKTRAYCPSGLVVCDKPLLPRQLFSQLLVGFCFVVAVRRSLFVRSFVVRSFVVCRRSSFEAQTDDGCPRTEDDAIVSTSKTSRFPHTNYHT